MARLHFYILICATLCFVCPLGGHGHQNPPDSMAFPFNAGEVVEKRLTLPKSHLLVHALNERAHLAAKETWFYHLRELKPAYQYRVAKPHSFEQYDVWLDANTGATLAIRPAFKRATATTSVFAQSPNPRVPLASQLVTAQLDNLLNVNPGSPLVGQYFSTANCCRYVKCPDANRICNPSEWQCASASDSGALASTKSFRTTRSSLGLDDISDASNTIFLEAPVCTRLPFAQISLNSRSEPEATGAPIDGESNEAEGDAFAEIQAYYWATLYFKHLRNLVDDPSFCFRSQAMSCAPDGNALHIFVNQMVPRIRVEPIREQLLAGKGTADKPIMLDEMSRVTNAAYVTGLDNTASTFEPSLEETLGEFIKPYDYLIFFQGDVDLAYDGDVVFHEMTHALTTTLLPNMAITNLNEKGLYVDMGAMDEGYADYFAASFTNSSAIGEYAAFGPSARASLRDADNLHVCPQDIIGEVHQDANLWSGALWDIRSFVVKSLGSEHIIDIDRLFLNALIGSSSSENFADQSQRILDLLQNSSTLNSAYSVAEDAFYVRGLRSCERIFSLNEVIDDERVVTNPKSSLFLMSPESLGLSNFAPPPLQFKVTLPKDVSRFQIVYAQTLTTDSLVNSAVREIDTPTPLSFLVSPSGPITWTYKNDSTVPMVNGAAVSFDPHLARAENRGGSWIFASDIPGDASKPRDVYISMISTDYDYVVHSVRVDFQNVQPTTQAGAGCACSAAAPKPFSLFESSLYLLCAVVFLASRIKQD